ncbi:hypothetical protein [Frondihabitans peucedani]|uniref:Uncharacterized protein n=1 Tax=Frondihabitans peucedani TaxID=598626 RepID=A0ABP8E1M6_9MICO
MTLFAPQSQHACPSTSNPVFDRLVSSSRRGARSAVTPITTRSLLVDRSTNPVLASILDEERTPAEAAEVGRADTVAQLIVRLLDDEAPTRRSRRRRR